MLAGRINKSRFCEIVYSYWNNPDHRIWCGSFLYLASIQIKSDTRENGMDSFISFCSLSCVCSHYFNDELFYTPIYLYLSTSSSATPSLQNSSSSQTTYSHKPARDLVPCPTRNRNSSPAAAPTSPSQAD